MIIRKVILNNKSRKGEYYYLKEGGKRGAYYKAIPKLKETYKQYYVDRYINKKPIKLKERIRGQIIAIDILKGAKELREQQWRGVKSYLKEIKRRPHIQKAIKAGMTKVEIQDIHQITPKQLFQHKKKLLEPLVLDKQLLKILAKEENFKKIKHRLEYGFEVYDKNGRLLTHTKKFNEAPGEALKQARRIFYTGAFVKLQGTPDDVGEKLKYYGFKTRTRVGEGYVKKVKVIIVFRKAK